MQSSEFAVGIASRFTKNSLFAPVGGTGSIQECGRGTSFTGCNAVSEPARDAEATIVGELLNGICQTARSAASPLWSSSASTLAGGRIGRLDAALPQEAIGGLRLHFDGQTSFARAARARPPRGASAANSSPGNREDLGTRVVPAERATRAQNVLRFTKLPALISWMLERTFQKV